MLSFAKPNPPKRPKPMILEHELKAEDIHRYTMSILTEHITLKANGYRCTTEMVLDVILKASAESSSIEAACQDLKEVADSNTLRDYLNTALDKIEVRE